MAQKVYNGTSEGFHLIVALTAAPTACTHIPLHEVSDWQHALEGHHKVKNSSVMYFS